MSTTAMSSALLNYFRSVIFVVLPGVFALSGPLHAAGSDVDGLKMPVITQSTAANDSEATSLMVSDAYARETLPGQNVAVAYLTVRNSADVERSIVGVKMSVQGVAEIHGHSHANGMMKMFRVDTVAVPPKGDLLFEPGGYHLMLMQLERPLRAGDSLTVSLVYADGYEQEVIMSVRSLLE